MRKKSLCAGCRNPLPAPFLDLGDSPLANSYTEPGSSETEEFRAPLAVSFCPACYLVQLTHIVPPKQLFFSYLYFSSFSESYLRHAKAMADELCDRFQLGPQSTVVEVASNDGYLLQYFQQRNVRVLGIDPAENIGEAARLRGIPTWTRFFGPDLLPELEQEVGKVTLIIGNNVLAHVPKINAFLSAVHGALGSSGHAVFEFPYVLDLLERNEYDTIYHEHVYYYSLSALKRLAERACLHLVDVSHQKVHGGTLRVFLAKYAREQPSAAVEAMLLAERAAGLLTPERYSLLGSAVEKQKAEFTGLLRRLRSARKTIAAYGAPAKGNTLLNACGIDNKLIDFTVDKNEHKQGLLLPGSRIPILAPEALLEHQPDYAVVLPWNLATEIMEQQAEYVRRGGRFILPIPSPRIVGANELPEAA
ncbi:MAG: SAM-dependent methyltransferase [Bryobacterales bacterium]|jgi:SAM-dependent methyltransferase|nr:SAM-dependent methyltransferase [Bryobacterales bacterium]